MVFTSSQQFPFCITFNGCTFILGHRWLIYSNLPCWSIYSLLVYKQLMIYILISLQQSIQFCFISFKDRSKYLTFPISLSPIVDAFYTRNVWFYDFIFYKRSELIAKVIKLVVLACWSSINSSSSSLPCGPRHRASSSSLPCGPCHRASSSSLPCGPRHCAFA